MLQPTGGQPAFYSICLFPYDAAERFHGPLAQLRRQFFENRRPCRASGEEVAGGQLCRYRGGIHRKRLRWVCRGGGLVREEALPVSGGSALLLRDARGFLYCRVLYRENQWERSSYFRPGDSRPAVILEPVAGENRILRTDLCPETGKYRRQELLPCPFAPGTAHQSAVNNQVGSAPSVIASTSAGDFCYCPPEEQTLRLQWEGRLMETDLHSLPRFIPKNPETAEEAPLESPPELPLDPLPGPAPHGEPEKEPAEEAPAAAIEPNSYAANHEVFRVDVEPPIHSTRYRVAVKRTRGPVQVDSRHLRPSTREEAPAPTAEASQDEDPEDAVPFQGRPAAKRIIVSAEESCLYFGELLDGMRTGRGRTEQESGATAYEGDYKNDQRDGWGACYYRSGEPCYIGGWKENRREGLGATFQNGTHALHVGKWKDGVPGKMATLFDGEGNLRFAGQLENGQRQGVGVSYRADDGALFVGKWKDNRPTGEGTEFDAQGNLVYTGMWKDGKRHGRGTEFDAQGNVVFTGEWRDDCYYEGVHYSRMLPPDQAPQG